MNFEVSALQTTLDEIALTYGQRTAIGHFQDPMVRCIDGWSSNTNVELSFNMLERFGPALALYFQHALAQTVGDPVELEFSNNGNDQATLVKMPHCNNPRDLSQVQAIYESSTETLAADAVAPPTTEAAEKVPRPLNRWVIFRDAEYQRLKATNPKLTVQEISKLCSKKWKSMGKKVQMDIWQPKADAAREEHRRMYPNYKYSPRKAGEKKKRQSRKAKHAAAAAREQTMDIPHIPGTPTMTIEDNFVFDNAFGLDNTATGQVVAANDWTHMASSPFSTGPAVDGLHAESLRHERLQAEVGAELGFGDSFAFFGDEAFAFRDGADSTATLPSIYSEGY